MRKKTKKLSVFALTVVLAVGGNGIFAKGQGKNDTGVLNPQLYANQSDSGTRTGEL